MQHDGIRSREILHERVVAGEEDALRELIGKMHPSIRLKLRRRFRRASDDLIADAVEDAIVHYTLKPNSYDPARGVPVFAFLYLAARRNLIDAIKVERRRRHREQDYADTIPEKGLDHWVGRHNRPLVAVYRDLHACSKVAEREALRVWFAGEHRTGPIATALGLAALPPGHQQKAVKRFKDRIKKRLSRLLTAQQV
jgi:DNA-directed RNA polymerase specialized sigma24 family protein